MEITPTEIEARICNLQQKLIEQTTDGAVILLQSDLFYFTGTVQNSYLYIPASGQPVLMVKKSLTRGQQESPLKNIVAIKTPKQIPEILAAYGYSSFSKIGLELDVLPFNLYKSYQNIFPTTEFIDISPAIKDIRAVKSAYEIELMRGALAVIDQAFLAVPSFLRAGMSELELAALFEAEMRKRGYAGPCKMRAFNQDFFFGNVCTGGSGFYPNYFDGPVGGQGASAAQPQGAGWKKINRNEVIYIDYTSIVKGYTGDQTRIFCIGELSPKLVKAYEAALLIEAEIVKSSKPGTLAEEPYLLAVKLAAELGYQDNFMGYKPDQVKFVGHGIGLELDECPILAKGMKTPIVPGMTFALEPKFVFPEGAIGIENSFVMTETGPQYLSITPQVITYV
ncbi:Methionine aminopeptidase 1, mitochondrial [Sporomusa silvacetica DSM 10669]|uniref:Methionine aminopeptidase 1, mitochondrial n=1 Tax=Sporomusa silvacetica DSM 10669 TaxID=1123289 RepID=A0ABZ3IQB6_9FIRM|nr:Xaa-Pro peptidase family protein [Sporomusa silvacetica]OZC15801.1 Xaa-Pro dipeptidase [Sporomusa silvacetica DSM 10669]